MSVSIQTLEGLKRQLTIEIPADKIDSEVEQKISQIAKTAKVDGFRPGKVPAKVLVKRYGESARQDVITRLIESSYLEALQEEKINPAGYPKIDIKESEHGKPLQFTATFEVFPEIKLVELENQKVEQFESELTEKDIDDAIEKIRKQSANWVEVDRAAKDGDRITIDFEGFIDDKPFQGGKANDFQLVFGSKSMIPGFEEQMLGFKKDDAKDIKVTFPKDYHAKDLADKPAVFKIKVHKVEEPKLPEIDAEFLKKFGITEGGIEKLKETLKKHMESELKSALKIKNKNAIMDKLLELNEFEVPEALIDEEAERMAHQAAHRYTQDPKKAPNIPKELFTTQAKRRVQLGLLLAEIVKKYNIKSDDERIKEIIKNITADYDKPDEIQKWYFEDRKRLQEFEMVDIENQVVEKMLSEANVAKKKIPYSEVLN